MLTNNNLYTVAMILDHCFLSNQRARHEYCLAHAGEVFGFAWDDPTLDDDYISDVIYNSSNANNFWCLGDSVKCPNCEEFIPPGNANCLNCNQHVDVVPAVLSKEEWQKALTDVMWTSEIEQYGQVRKNMSKVIRTTTWNMIEQRGMRYNFNEATKPEEAGSAVRNDMLTNHDAIDKDSIEYKQIWACATVWYMAGAWIKRNGLVDEWLNKPANELFELSRTLRGIWHKNFGDRSRNDVETYLQTKKDIEEETNTSEEAKELIEKYLDPGPQEERVNLYDWFLHDAYFKPTDPDDPWSSGWVFGPVSGEQAHWLIERFNYAAAGRGRIMLDTDLIDILT